MWYLIYEQLLYNISTAKSLPKSLEETMACRRVQVHST